MTSVFVFALTLLLIIPGIIFGIYCTFALSAVVLAGKKINGALAYSKEVVEGRWWVLFGYLIVLGFVTSITDRIFSYVSNLIFGIIPIPYLGYIVSLLITDVMQLFATIYVVLVFINWDTFRVQNPEKMPMAEVPEKAL